MCIIIVIMKYSEIEKLIKAGKTALLPNYVGYFKWDYTNQSVYFQNGNYIKYDLDNEKKRDDWYYII